MIKKFLVIALTLSFINSYADNFNEQVQAVLDKSVEQYGMPGIQLSIKYEHESSPHNFASGFANKITFEPMHASNHALQIGSITKSFIAAILLMLEDDSDHHQLPVTFNLNQTVGDWLPEYPKYANIKIRNLLNMTSGIYNYTENPKLFRTIAKEPGYFFNEDDLIQLAYPYDPYFSQGEGYHYSNTNFTLAGLIIERVTGKPVETVIKERIFNRFPLQFVHTEYKPKTYPNKGIIMAHGYSEDNVDHDMFFGQDITDYSLSWAGAAGGITSTTEDLVHWTELLFSGQIIPKDKLAEMQSIVCIDAEHDCSPGEQLPQNSKIGYGLGIGYSYDPIYGPIWTHNGGTLGYSSTFMWLPAKKVSIAIIINRIAPEISDSDGDTENEKMLVLEKVINKLPS